MALNWNPVGDTPSGWGIANISETKVTKSTSPLMDSLWRMFDSQKRYPKFYLGYATVTCTCPKSGVVELVNPAHILTKNPSIGDLVSVTIEIKNGSTSSTLTKELIYNGIAETPKHIWLMDNKSSHFELAQKGVDMLLDVDKKALGLQL
jgi:hypothetical protein